MLSPTGFRMSIAIMQTMRCTDPGSGQKRLAKFTGRYGTAVHAAWASAGLAPTLFDVTKLDCHMLLINMELLPESWRVLSDLSQPELLG